MPRRKQGSVRSFLNWFGALSSMDKIGVLLMFFSGVAFLAKLFQGMQFLTPVSAAKFSGSRTQKPKALEVLFDGKFSDLAAPTASPDYPIPRAALPKGCEDFRLERGSRSPLDARVHGVVIGERHRETQTEKCLIAIETQRKVKPRDSRVYFVEGIPEGLEIPCPQAPGEYKARKDLRCIGWDGPEIFQAHQKDRIDKAVRKVVQATLQQELKSPVLSTLQGLNKKEAEKRIHKFLNGLTLSNQQRWADCKVPRVLSFSPVDLAFDRNCAVFEKLEEFAWSIHRIGFSSAAKAFLLESLSSVLDDSFISPPQMVLRNKGLAAKIREGLRAVESQSTVFFSAIAGSCHVDAKLCNAALHGTDQEVRKAIEEDKDSLAVLLPAT